MQTPLIIEYLNANAAGWLALVSLFTLALFVAGLVLAALERVGDRLKKIRKH